MKNLLLLAAILFCTSCSSTQKTVDTVAAEEQRLQTQENSNASISLADRLSKVPGLQVSGNGNNATVKVRGASSFYSSADPLFIINGQQITGGLPAVAQMVPVAEISRIKVLKNASDTGIYGVRGANGVIEIYLKKG